MVVDRRPGLRHPLQLAGHVAEEVAPPPRAGREERRRVRAHPLAALDLVLVDAPRPVRLERLVRERGLAMAEAAMRKRIRDQHMAAGVTFRDPDSCQVDSEVRIAADVVKRRRH